MRHKTHQRRRGRWDIQNTKRDPSGTSLEKSHAQQPIRVFIADRHEIIRVGVRALLEGAVDLEVVGEADDGNRLLVQVPQARPDVVLLESRLTGRSDVEICQRLLAALPTIGIVLIGPGYDAAAFRHVRETGVRGFLLNNVSQSELVQAIHTVAQGMPYFCPEATAATFRLLRQQRTRVGHGAGLQILSPQERRVIALIADGCTNKEIAARLVLSEKTVKNYIVNMFTKLEIERRTQAVALYVKAQHHHRPMRNDLSE
jgi:DNA-binding NarL/FixJ family response regulator